ncbi:MAG: hypothetical protein IAB19_08475 [Proteobacteria bacterium]|uniref:DUF2927 domain-containing protein n=1 Tax=Candidatus Avisuccinivibrio stercorigallinarum TaxID=2840704 RepID=A0A9D9DD63_9GAMM|nr:hypothetical protein [Candidatus Avisuccinivibrio stercorigallinarum]
MAAKQHVSAFSLIKTTAAAGRLKQRIRAAGAAMSAALAGTVLAAAACCSAAEAYELTTPYKSGHFALHQVILERYEDYNEEFRAELTRDLQVQNRMQKLYQSSAAIFPYNSKGFKGTIGESMLGLLSIANYAPGEEQITLVNANTASYAGLYFSFSQLKDFVDNKALNSLFDELLRLPLMVTDIPVNAAGFDSKGNFYLTGRSSAMILDLRAEDSAYYTQDEIRAIKANECKIDALLFIERICPDLPLYISARAAVNHISCASAEETAANGSGADGGKEAGSTAAGK